MQKTPLGKSQPSPLCLSTAAGCSLQLFCTSSKGHSRPQSGSLENSSVVRANGWKEQPVRKCEGARESTRKQILSRVNHPELFSEQPVDHTSFSSFIVLSGGEGVCLRGCLNFSVVLPVLLSLCSAQALGAHPAYLSLWKALPFLRQLLSLCQVQLCYFKAP